MPGRLVIFIWILCGLVGCTLPQNPDPTAPILPENVQSSSQPTAITQSTLIPLTATAIPPTLPPTTVIIDGWEQIVPGIEQRRYDYEDEAQFLVVRVDPTLFDFRAHYRPGDALRLDSWEEQLPDASVIINANFFDPNAETLGLVVADGQAFGRSYQDRGGMFFIQNGVPGIRSNIYEPYMGEVLDQAVQGFPMLVLDGVQTYTQSSRIARRTVIAQDAQGRVLLLVTRRGSISLAGLSAFLATSDMNIVRAVNLDGGGSTMMSVKTLTTSFQVDTFDAVPVVLGVYPKS